MNAMNAYRRHQQTPSWTRIDLLLALFDGAIDRLNRGMAAMSEGDDSKALTLFARVQSILMELAAGVNPEAGDPSSANLLRLYEYCCHAVSKRELSGLESAVRCLTTVRDGFRAIREEAIQLEHSGAIPRADASRMIEAVG